MIEFISNITIPLFFIDTRSLSRNNLILIFADFELFFPITMAIMNCKALVASRAGIQCHVNVSKRFLIPIKSTRRLRILLEHVLRFSQTIVLWTQVS